MPNLNNELAKERNRAAAERTMMAWIRTCLSLISFGFGLDKIIGAINRSRFDGSAHAGMSVRLVAMGFVLIGIVAMAILQAWFYQRTRSVFLAIVIHAVFNTIPLTIVLLFEGSPAAVLANLLLWAVVIVLKSRTDRQDRDRDAGATV